MKKTELQGHVYNERLRCNQMSASHTVLRTERHNCAHDIACKTFERDRLTSSGSPDGGSQFHDASLGADSVYGDVTSM